jgi:dethiobiotin synthetase
MSGVLVVTGTDTGIGKTVAAATLAAALGAAYWKPVQAGIEDETDSAAVARLAGVTVLPEAYRLALPASPHLAAEREGVTIDRDRLALPPAPRPLVVEGAGGVLVPIRRDPVWLYADQFARWGAPVVLCARTSLGTINHSLTAIEALRARGVPIAGLIFIGAAHPDNEAVIPAIAGVRRIGRLPWLDAVSREALAAATQALDLDAVREAMG